MIEEKCEVCSELSQYCQCNVCESCNENAGITTPELCPYDQDINDMERLCNCCAACRDQCCQSI